MNREIPELFNDVIGKWKPTYMSIIFLTIHYHDNEEGGLRLLHYRYALVINDKISNEWKQKMTEFFGWKLKQLYYLREVRKCITTRQNLVKKLNNLVKWGLLDQIPKTKDRDYPLYRINTENYNKIDLNIRKIRLKNIFSYKVDKCSEEMLTKIERDIEDFLDIKRPEPPKFITKEETLKTHL